MEPVSMVMLVSLLVLGVRFESEFIGVHLWLNLSLSGG